MPRQRSIHPAFDVDFIQAELQIGFALLDLAEDESLFGTHDCARRAVDEAEQACSKGERRLLALGDSAFHRLEPEIEKLHSAIEEMKPRFK